MGEIKNHIFNVGSPDVDIILNKKLPSYLSVKKRYSIEFDNFSILLWHPVTSQVKNLRDDTNKLINFLKKLNQNFVVIYPNNDPGSKIILDCYSKIKNEKFKIVKNLRFEYFLTLLKTAKYIIGNSSSAIYEAPVLRTPGIDIGERQNKRIRSKIVKHFSIDELNADKIQRFLNTYKPIKKKFYGTGNSSQKILKILQKNNFWKIPTQKFFSDIDLS